MPFCFTLHKKLVLVDFFVVLLYDTACKGECRMTLDQLTIGKSAIIKRVGGEGALRRRLLEMGLTPKTKVKVHKIAPMGDPVELHLRGYSLSIRLADAANIEVEIDG